MFLNKVTLLKEKIPSFNLYPFSIPAIESLDEIKIDRNVTFFVGENGSGKSTLLEAIADKCGFNTAGGGRNNSYDVYETDSELSQFIRLSWMPKVTNGFFYVQNHFIILLPILMRWMRTDLKIMEENHCYINRMENPFCHYF